MKERKILLAEDDPDHAALITDVLELGGIKKRVILMRDGQEVVDYFQKAEIDGIDNKRKTQISLVILDLNLPKVDGMNVLKFIKEDTKYSSIHVIILSTSSDDRIIEEAYKNGADGFISKDASYKEFIKQIQTLEVY